MNKFFKLLPASLLAAALFVQSCDDDDIEPAPTVVVDPTTASNVPGETVSANLTIEAPNGAQSLVIYVAGEEDENRSLSGVDISSPIEYEYTIPEDAVIGSKIVIAFQVIDNENYPSAITNFVVTVGDPVITLQGNLTTQTLDASQPYLLVGQVFIPSGVTLTIPAGTVIKGDKASKATLIVQPGGSLVANGTATEPVVFTSAQAEGERDRGDWGGVVVLGNAFVNQTALPAIEGISPSQNYGNITSPSTNETENSGTLRYVRIEYAGIELTPNNETNSLTLGGVGNGTTVEYVQVSFGGDDGFEWFGGTVNGKYLISLSTWDDDFDTDFGWGGNVQFGLVVRNPFFADQSGSNAFESDNQGNGNAIAGLCDGSTTVGCTRGVFSNITVLGPRDYTTSFGGSGTSARSISGNYQNAIHIRRRTALSIFNSFFSGFPVGVRVDDQGTLDNLTSGAGKHAYNVLASPNNTELGTSTSSSNVAFATGLLMGDATAIRSYWTDNSNSVVKPTSGEPWSPTPGTPAGSVDPYPGIGLTSSLFWGGQTSSNYPSNPNFALMAGTEGMSNLNSGANFSDPKLSGGFFTTTTFRGAFGSEDWTNGWAEFQPLNANY